jgi:peptidoglycan/xylan/chitin deacetylase (PgdA/CDA1 family)
LRLLTGGQHKAKVIMLMFVLVLGSCIYHFYVGGVTRFITVMKTGVEPIFRIETKKNITCITYDLSDVDDKTVESIISSLNKHKAGATFFVSKNLIYKNQAIIKKLSAERFDVGLLVGNDYSTELKEEEIVDQVKYSEKEIKKITEKQPEFFRPYKAMFVNKSVEVMDLLGYKSVIWDIDTVEWNKYKTKSWVESTLKQLKKGSIVRIDPRSESIGDKTEALLSALKNKGFKVLSVSDAILQK